MGLTLRFPRFKKLRTDKDWTQALGIDEFLALKNEAEEAKNEKKFKIDEARKQRRTRKRQRSLVIQGQEDEFTAPYAGPATKVFEGLSFFVMSEAAKPIKKSKAELEALIRANGGNVVAAETDPHTILIADRKVIKVASIAKRDQRNIIRPNWLLDCVEQSEADFGRPGLLLPLEPHHLLHTISSEEGYYDDNIDEYGDSYARDVTPRCLLELFTRMSSKVEDGFEPAEILDQLHDHGRELDAMPGWMFHRITACFEDVDVETVRLFEFAGGTLADSVENDEVTHVVVSKGDTRAARRMRQGMANKKRLPRIVSHDWVTESWAEGTRLDEERASP